jgi:hypothetical protein
MLRLRNVEVKAAEAKVIAKIVRPIPKHTDTAFMHHE